MIKFERISSDGYQMSLAKGRGGGGRVSLYSEVPCLGGPMAGREGLYSEVQCHGDRHMGLPVLKRMTDTCENTFRQTPSRNFVGGW